LTATLEKRTPQLKGLNAELVTVVATGFLKRIGHKEVLKPKKVSLEEGIYTVEVEMKKFTALIHVDAETQEIISYEIQPKGEETSSFSFSPKTIVIMVVITAVVSAALHFTFKFLGL